MKKILSVLALITFMSVPVFSANAILPPKMPEPVDTSNIVPVDNSKVIFAPEITPTLEPIEDPTITIPYVPLPLPDIEIPPNLLLGPTISDIKMASNDNSLLIEWTTNKPATSKIEYGPTEAYQKSLEDKELVTEHAMAIPASPGEIHLRISSDDSLDRHSESEDILVLIPEAAIPTLYNDEDATSTDETTDSDENLEMDIINANEESKDKDDAEPLLKVNGIDSPEKSESNLTATNAILGGIALLLAGILIGVLVKSGKKE